jgi:hypothetical protein
MSLREVLSERRETIHTRWLEDTLAAYPADAAGFFRRQQDRFQNPVGHTFAQTTRALVDALADGIEPQAVAEPLERLIKIRSIQELGASQTVGFIFGLKAVLRSELAALLREPGAQAEWTQIEHSVDQLLLLAFDVYARCREQLFDIRVNEVKRTVSGLVRRINRIDQEAFDAVTSTDR